MHADHVQRVLSSVTSASAAAQSGVAASWRRCFDKHSLDPGTASARDERDPERLASQRERLERLLRVAEPRLDDLYRMVGHCGRAIFLTDADGLVLTGRTRGADAAAFSDWGLEPGRDWSEEVQGTNGIGTCLIEGRPLVIHRDQHYLPQNIAMSCIDAPVFGPEGEIIAALDVSSARSDQTEGFNQLIAAMVEKLTHQIEADLFRDHFAGHRFLIAGDEAETAGLLAVSRDDIVLGATRGARQAHGLTRTGRLDPIPLRDLTGEAAQGLEGAERAALMRAITRADGNLSAAARDLGIGRATLYRRLKRLGLDENGRDLSRN